MPASRQQKKAVAKAAAKKSPDSYRAAKKTSGATKELTAGTFMEALKKHQSAAELKKIQGYFKSGEGEYGAGDTFIGVRMGQVFELAKEFMEMPAAEIELLMESPVHEARAGAMSIMDKAARHKKTPESRRKELFDLYMRRHDRVNNWDLVDLGCLHMTGSYLFDKPRNILYKLARSKNLWERRTAMISTTYFIRQGELDDAFKLAELLLHDKEDLVHKAAGWMLRFAGSKDRKRLIAFLDRYAGVMPRTLLRYALEHFDKKERDHYMNMKKDLEKKTLPAKQKKQP
jgi:3-methyladenine DNA glycosylase AlkD